MNLRLLICFLPFCYFANAQPVTTKPSSGILFSTQFSLGRPYGDLANRYGRQICVGGNLEYQPNWNFLNFGFGYSYFFGSKVKEDVLAPFRTPNYGLIIGADNALAEMKLGERGHILKIYLGGIIPIGAQHQARKD